MQCRAAVRAIALARTPPAVRAIATPSAESARTSSKPASAHLFEEARKHEEEELAIVAKRTQRDLGHAQASEQAWTGEESQKDAVLRMLVDKYPPLRVKGLEKAHQQPTLKDPAAELARIVKQETEDDDGNPLIIVRPRERPAAEPDAKPKLPWEITYKKPDDYREAPKITTGVRLAVAASQSIRKDPGRLFAAREASMDYASGEPELAKAKQAAKRYRLPGGRQHGQGALPTSIKGYVGFVEDKIERARQRGFFKNIKGRGKPMVKDPDAENPFIETTERLMNRIVQRQGAAPPWVLLQQELVAETESWRKRVQDAWRRRAVRMLSLDGGEPPSLEFVQAYRDSEWLQREQAYHEAGMRDLNSLLRRYNGAAPASVRRAAMKVHDELEGCFMREAADIHAELVRRYRFGPGEPLQLPTTTGEMEGKTGGLFQKSTAYTRPIEPREGLWPALKRALGDFRTMRL